MLVLTWFYYRSILFCVFIQTFVFVALNKVCTVQVRLSSSLRRLAIIYL